MVLIERLKIHVPHNEVLDVNSFILSYSMNSIDSYDASEHAFSKVTIGKLTLILDSRIPPTVHLPDMSDDRHNENKCSLYIP